MLLELSRREAFMLGCLRHLGEVVVWGGLDCSELVALGEIAAGLGDRRASHRAQDYADLNRDEAAPPRVGDLGFYGLDWEHVAHVVVASYGGHILSADGATAAVKDPVNAAQNPRARVRLHADFRYYRSYPFLGFRRHDELDQP